MIGLCLFGLALAGCAAGQLLNLPVEIFPQQAPIFRRVQTTAAPEDQCSRKDRHELTECMKPLVKSWQDMLKRRNQDENSIFAIFKYSKREMLALCSDYRWLHESCYTPILLQKCSEHPFVSFIESHLSFGCVPPHNVTFFERFECIRSVTLGSSACLELIPGQYLPGREEGKCDNILPYHNCMAENIERACNVTGLQIFRATIRGFGCTLPPLGPPPPPEDRLPDEFRARLLAPPQDPNVLPPDAIQPVQQFVSPQPLNPEDAQRVENERQAVQKTAESGKLAQSSAFETKSLPKCDQDLAIRTRTCFSGLFDAWTVEDRNRQENFTNVTFPLFLYQKQALLDLCDAYAATFTQCNEGEIKVCQDEAVVKFAIENMGFPCGRNVLDFFANFDCLSEAVKSHPQCLQHIRGIFHPTNAEHKCDQMADFYKCNKEAVVSCPGNGHQMFQDSIKHFGCKLDFDKI